MRTPTRSKRATTGVLTVAVMSLAFGGTAAAALPKAPTRGRPIVNVELRSIDAVSSADAWLVGSRFTGDQGEHPVIRHWNGTAWRSTPAYRGHGALYSVAAVSTDDVWAVGEYDTSGLDGSQVLAMHWDGAAWSQVETPTFPDQFNRLLSVSYISSTHVLVRGTSYTGEGAVSPITLVWNGTTWRQGSGAETSITDIDALTPNDAWGAGAAMGDHAYAAHWDGRGWKRTRIPNLGPLEAVSAVGVNDVWSVGNREGFGGFFQHWNGQSWIEFQDPVSHDRLTGVSGSAADDVWATGYLGSTGVLEHWDGHSCSSVDNPGTPRTRAQLFDIVAVSSTDAWAVGFYDQSGRQGDQLRQLLMHWDGTAWTDYQPG